MRRPPASPQAIGLICAAAAQCLVGASAGVSAVLADYPAAAGQVLRYTIAAAVLFGLLAARRTPLLRPTRRELGLLALLALCGQTLYTLCMLGAVEYADPASVGSVVGAGPVLVAVAAPLFAGRRPGAAVVRAAALVAVGAALVQGSGHATALGLLLACGVALCEVAVPLVAMPLLPRLGPLRVAAYSTVAAIPQMLVLAAVSGNGTAFPLPSAPEAGAILYLAVALTAGAFLLWFAALTFVPAETAGLFLGVVPVAAAFSGLLLTQDGFTVGQFAGAALVGAGIAAGLRSANPAPADPTPKFPVTHPAPARAEPPPTPAPLPPTTAAATT